MIEIIIILGSLITGYYLFRKNGEIFFIDTLTRQGVEPLSQTINDMEQRNYTIQGNVTI